MATEKNILLLGAGFSTNNLGVWALTSGAITSAWHTFPQAKIKLFVPPLPPPPPPYKKIPHFPHIKIPYFDRDPFNINMVKHWGHGGRQTTNTYATLCALTQHVHRGMEILLTSTYRHLYCSLLIGYA